jgi:hypothetical protein
MKTNGLLLLLFSCPVINRTRVKYMYKNKKLRKNHIISQIKKQGPRLEAALFVFYYRLLHIVYMHIDTLYIYVVFSSQIGRTDNEDCITIQYVFSYIICNSVYRRRLVRFSEW